MSEVVKKPIIVMPMTGLQNNGRILIPVTIRRILKLTEQSRFIVEAYEDELRIRLDETSSDVAPIEQPIIKGEVDKNGETTNGN